MQGFLITLHIFVSISLITIVLLQAGKGADLGATFGTGSSQSLFGAGGSSTFLGKMTASAAIIFMLTSLSYRESLEALPSCRQKRLRLRLHQRLCPPLQPLQLRPNSHKKSNGKSKLLLTYPRQTGRKCNSITMWEDTYFCPADRNKTSSLYFK
jgi:protein translocase SecG subunit